MLELIKKNIHTNRWKGNAKTQLTLDDDFIVPDTMADVDLVILEQGEILSDSMKNMGDYINIKGKLKFSVLYRDPQGELQALSGNIPFDENINSDILEDNDYLGLNWDLEDLKADIINSRKVSVKAIVSFSIRLETVEDREAAEDIKENAFDEEGEIDVQSLKRSLEIASIAARRKDTFRIKEDISLTSNKPNIDRIMWNEMKVQGVNTRVLDHTLHLEGELMVFVLYAAEGEQGSVQWLEESIPFSGQVGVEQISEDMIPVISVRMVHHEMEVKPDADGEMREVSVDVVLELDMKYYQEEPLELLSDLYSTNRELELQKGKICFDQLLEKNMGKCRLAEKFKLEGRHVLQICHSEGDVKLDEVQIAEDSLNIDGVVEVKILYLTSEDNEPIKSVEEVIPFHYVEEAKGICEDSTYQLTVDLEQLSAAMLNGETMEIKATVSLEILVMQPVCEDVITGVQVKPADPKVLQEMPGITGYMVQPQDTLWTIAKRFHTTINHIKKDNTLEGDKAVPGEWLLLIKEI